MAVDRLSVTVPARVGQALRAYAEQEGLPVSAVVARAIEQQLRHAALSEFVDDFERTNGAFTAEQLAKSAALFDRAEKQGRTISRQPADNAANPANPTKRRAAPTKASVAKRRRVA